MDVQGYNSRELSACWEHKQGSRKTDDSRGWKGLELGKLTRWHDLPSGVKPAVEIIKFKEMKDSGFQSRLIQTSRTYYPGSGNISQVSVPAKQADRMSPI